VLEGGGGIGAKKDGYVGRGGAELVAVAGGGGGWVLGGGGGGGVELECVLYLVVDERGLEEQQFEMWEVVVIVPEDQLSPRTLLSLCDARQWIQEVALVVCVCVFTCMFVRAWIQTWIYGKYMCIYIYIHIYLYIYTHICIYVSEGPKGFSVIHPSP